MSRYPSFFTPFELGLTALKDRMSVGLVHTGLEELPDSTQRLAVFYAERVRHDAVLIVTGSITPAPSGVTVTDGTVFNDASHLAHHRHITDVVYREGGRIAPQIPHIGRYSYQSALVTPSALQAPTNRFTPRELSHDEVLTLIDDLAHRVQLAREASYDGIEVMGSEGYLTSELLTAHTNQRNGQWGGDYARHIRPVIEVVKVVHQRANRNFIIIYRPSMLDLISDGSTLAEVTELAKAIEAAEAIVINTGISWHEAHIPAITAPVPHGTFSWVTRKLRSVMSIPLITINHIGDPWVAEDILARDDTDMVSTARPFLADAESISKMQRDHAGGINACVGCSQACLDRIFVGKVASCLVNPCACHETLMPALLANAPRRLTVVGAGPTGLTFAANAVARGHYIMLFGALPEIGGQFNVTKQIPGKEELHETLHYYRIMLDLHGVDLCLNTRVTADNLLTFDETILVAGIASRLPAINGIDYPKVLSYLDALRDKAPVGAKMTIIDYGGIDLDTVMYLSQSGAATSQDIDESCREQGTDTSLQTAGGLSPDGPQLSKNSRQIVILQRKASKPGEGFGEATGWTHHTALLTRGVKMIPVASYEKIDDEGLHVTTGSERQLLAVDRVVTCAGQEPRRELANPLYTAGKTVHLIDSCDITAELDARRAVAQDTKLALAIQPYPGGGMIRPPRATTITPDGSPAKATVAGRGGVTKGISAAYVPWLLSR